VFEDGIETAQSLESGREAPNGKGDFEGESSDPRESSSSLLPMRDDRGAMYSEIGELPVCGM